jgi:chemotaxis methyl-accepting protein methylase
VALCYGSKRLAEGATVFPGLAPGDSAPSVIVGVYEKTSLASHSRGPAVPTVGIGASAGGVELQIEEDENAALKRVLDVMKGRTGHDLSKYKRNTVLRRVARRMQLTHSARIANYLAHLRETPEEARRLFNDLLITVTTFFRDPEAWSALALKIIAPLVERTGASEQLRVWVPGCATGEEAFTLAILFEEEFARREMTGDLVIFASDIDEAALSSARAGLFPNSIAADVSDARLARFFNAEDDHYRAVRQIRERIVFAAHSLLRDPPFSRLHLISCRNLLIYLDRELRGIPRSRPHPSLGESRARGQRLAFEPDSHLLELVGDERGPDSSQVTGGSRCAR